jgi:hypothetical protein
MIKKIQLTVNAVFCDRCGEDLHSYEGWGYVENEDGSKHYCEECALKVGALSPLDWVNKHNPTTRKYYAAELQGKMILAYYKCNTKKGYRIDRMEPFYDEEFQ